MYCGPSNQNFGWTMAHPAYPVVPPWGLGSGVSSPGGVRGGIVAFCCIVCLQWLQHFWFFGSLVSIAMSDTMKSNLGSGQICICWQLKLYKHHSCSNWQVDFCRVQNCGPPKFCSPVRPNTLNMPKAGRDKLIGYSFE